MPNKLNVIILILLIIGICIFTWGYFNLENLSFYKNNELPQKNAPLPKLTETPVKKEITAKIDNTSEIPILLADVNAYFASKKISPLSQQPVATINNTSLLKKLKSNDKNLVVIDIREHYERSLLRLDSYSSLQYIRFGDLINNNFENIPKNTEIVIVGYTENREIVAASYLKSQGYTNVTILKGGLLQWAVDELPLINIYKATGRNNIQKDNISSVLIRYSEKSIRETSPSPKELTFGNYSPDNVNILVWDNKTLENYINSLPSNENYILTCQKTTGNLSCWEALYFWYVAKERIHILGYIIR